MAYDALPNRFPEENRQALEQLQKHYDALPELTAENHDGQIANVVNAIRQTEELLIDGKQGRNAIELIMAIYRSAATGAEVCLPITPDDPFYRLETMAAAMPRFFQKTRSVQVAAEAPPISFGGDVGQ